MSATLSDSWEAGEKAGPPGEELKVLAEDAKPGHSSHAASQPVRRRTWLIIGALLVVAGITIGIGIGFGVGWAAHPDGGSQPDGTPLAATVDALPDSFLPLRPTGLAVLGEGSNELVAATQEQWAVLAPALRVFSPLVSALARDTAVVDPHVLRTYLASLPDGPASSALVAGVWQAAQRLLGSPLLRRRLADVTSSLVAVFRWFRSEMDRLGAGGAGGGAGRVGGNGSVGGGAGAAGGAGRRQRALLDGSGGPVTVLELDLTRLVTGAQSAPEVQGALRVLRELYREEQLQDLLRSLLQSLRSVAADMPLLRDLAAAQHPDPRVVALGLSQLVQVTVDGGETWGAGLSVTVLPDLPPNVLLLPEEDPAVPARRMLRSAAGQHAQQGRALAEAAGGGVVALPPGFTVRPPSEAPPLLIPLVFHVLQYRNADGSLGPPGVEAAADAVTRLLRVTNVMAAPSGMQMYAAEVRSDAGRWPYLLKYGANRTTWLNCAANSAFAYELCGDVIRTSAVDFPRSINVFVVSDGPLAKYLGYAFAGGSAEDPLLGHIGLIWSALSSAAGAMNNQESYETGAATLWHEVLHHLGVRHTFSTDGSCSEEAADGLADTPLATAAVWSQPWALDAYAACQLYVQNELKSDWSRIYGAWRSVLGVPSADQRPFADSCPNSPGYDELANWLTYSFDTCFAAFGHATAQQVRAAHALTAARNPLLYAWAQYYAANPPPASLQYRPGAGEAAGPAPPPAVPSPPQARGGARGCPLQLTRMQCRCKDTWSVDGRTYQGCTTQDADSHGGSWCAVVPEDGCTGAKNGWWDLCTPVAALGCIPASPSPAPTATPTPSPSPSPAAAPLGAPSCGAGAPTLSGAPCSTSRWTTPSAPPGSRFTGCANPNSDPRGAWCALAKGATTPSGATWDYCLPACNTPGTAAAPSQAQASQGCTSTASQLPEGCTCRPSWTATVNGTTLRGLQGCSTLPPDPRPVCVVAGCAASRNNGKLFTCACPTA